MGYKGEWYSAEEIEAMLLAAEQAGREAEKMPGFCPICGTCRACEVCQGEIEKGRLNGDTSRNGTSQIL